MAASTTLLPAGAVPGLSAAGNAAPVPLVLAAIDAGLAGPLSRTGAGLHSIAQLSLYALEMLQVGAGGWVGGCPCPTPPPQFLP